MLDVPCNSPASIPIEWQNSSLLQAKEIAVLSPSLMKHQAQEEILFQASFQDCIYNLLTYILLVY